ncbi:MAG TPA: hypothetical protein VKZ61_02660 [Thermomicrobiales bacterium]|jgi:hypothetical protein|nr:hypothetical protein [Thermomicrobiales bacterium]
MSIATPRRFYIDHDAAHEEAIVRRVLVTPTRPAGRLAQQTTHTRNATTLLGLGRLVRGRLIRRVR